MVSNSALLLCDTYLLAGHAVPIAVQMACITRLAVSDGRGPCGTS